MATHVTTLTIDHTKVAGDLTDYVVAIINDSDVGYDELYALCLEGGGDIRIFKSDDVTELPREIVSFSVTSETGEIHVKYSGTLSSTVDTDIHIYADGTSSDYAVTATYGRNAVWSGSQAVYHFDSVTDSTSTGANFTNTGSTPFNAGKIGNSADFGTSNATKYFQVASELGLAVGAARTISTWVNISTTPSGGSIYDIWGTSYETEDVAYLIEYGDIGGTLKIRAGRARYYVDDPTMLYTTTLTVGTWYKIDLTIDASRNQVLYLNGTSVASNTAASGNGAGAVFDGSYMSRAGFAVIRLLSGKSDETRVSSSVRTSDWLTTEYNNQNSPSTFYSVTAISGGFSQDLNETTTLTDTVQKATTRNLNDSTTLADSFTSLAVSLLDLAENLSVSDNLAARITGRVLSEAVTATESIVNTFSKVLAETTTLTVGIANIAYKALQLDEAVTLVESYLVKLNGINALWRDIYTDTVDVWSDIYNDN